MQSVALTELFNEGQCDAVQLRTSVQKILELTFMAEESQERQAAGA
jgi:hypothetical protein